MHIIDLRSDTVTKPTEEMRRAMAEAPVGDDVYGDDPTINALQELGAKMTGMEASLFVPSGTFGNQLALFTHCVRGQELIIGETNHVLNNEAGGPAVIAGVQTRTVPVTKGYMDPDSIDALIRKTENVHYPTTGLICIENAHGSGHVMKKENMREIYELSREYGVPVHCDGARILNAAVAQGVELRELTQYVDSVSICLSKGLCAPVGSLLVGSHEFIKKALFKRKLMGGGMRQVGVLGAAGLLALEKMSLRLYEDHENARRLAEGMAEIPGITATPEDVEINMIFMEYSSSKYTPDEFSKEMEKRGVIISSPYGGKLRFVTHNGVTGTDVDYVLASVRELLS